MLRALGTTILLFALMAVAKGETPNFLFVIADDCTYWDMECYGGQAKTPHLNQLCREGLTFRKCFQAAPMCSPTRHCLYTGLYPVKSGAYPNHTFVKQGTESVAHFLQRAGYRVALSGKRHIQPTTSFPFEYSGKKNPDFAAINKLMGECKAEGKPFCLFACSNEPHTPWDKGDPSAYPSNELKLPEFFVDTPSTREAYSKYLAEITFYDDQVGKLLKLLDEHDLVDNTLVIIVSEQGNSFPFAKWTCYDMGLQSGMIARWPGKVKPGSRTDAMVEYVDVVPTFLEIAGASQTGLDGRSFLGVLTGARDKHKDHSFAIHTTRGIINGSPSYGIRSVRSSRYRYIRNLTPESRFQNIVFRDKWWHSWVAKADAGDAQAKAMVNRYQVRPAEELFDAQADPLNQRNLADQTDLANVKAELRQKLDAWMESQGDLGQVTELAAFDRQWSNRNKKKTNSKKKARGAKH